MSVDWRLLKKVSRSFYLTLRLLPAPVRESIALAYLLARLTDTKADGAVSEGERDLLQRESELVSALEHSEDRLEIEEVWRTIQAGQEFDRVRFHDNVDPLTDTELDRYTYLVAGCVGEFWTKICAKHLSRFSRLETSKMMALGIAYGKGLQLINILRDREEDGAMGRVYLTDERVPHYLSVARENLRSARAYVDALRMRRLRMATVLPVLIGEETLDLIDRADGGGRVKVSRRRVWLILFRSLFY